MKKFSSTTKASYRRNSSTKRWRIIVIAVLIVSLLSYAVPKATSYVAGVALAPIAALINWAATSESAIPNYVRSRASLTSEIAALEAQLEISKAADATVRVLESENASLQSVSSASTTVVAAQVIARPPYTPYDRVVLNQGTRAGVTVGAPVYVAKHIAIGSVIAVTPWQSVVELLSTHGVESTVYIFGPDIYTTAVGQGDGVLKIGVPQGIPLTIDDPVTTPVGSNGILGSITHIETEASRPEQYAYITLPVALQQLQTLYIGSEALTTMSFESAREVVGAVRNSLFTVDVPEGVLVDIQSTSTATTSPVSTTTEAL